MWIEGQPSRTFPSGVLVPEGHRRIAQRFNAGSHARLQQVPQGRPSFSPTIPLGAALFQPSLRDSVLSVLVPGVETPGYFQESLRDMYQTEFPRCIAWSLIANAGRS